MAKIVTIGFAQKSLQHFLELLRSEKVTCLIDTRLNNTSQLSGFAKKKDLKFILEEFMNIKYIHRVDMAPTKDILKDFKNNKITWNEYTKKYLALLEEREIKNNIDDLFTTSDTVCFLCSEHNHTHCHRSLLSEYIKENFANVEIIHLQ
ncbi:hypothetical protein JCM21714_3788 [Gracilibacillus boraciitolerans JCM 21714]|uniref:DUF488 domain-containing protein n=1 Tax=Gracilibacillus boraciitolerans JCM 21714 TaxID=1298598 RepID=W4VP42_9BACI|nr:DUF488 domain-containing protein [Gracilibacillus boraciitolerans]GAE94613.1 hypothetical protein JCM21714_3788 [Gracilibacillus boraciitolerans JCM 21714]